MDTIYSWFIIIAIDFHHCLCFKGIHRWTGGTFRVGSTNAVGFRWGWQRRELLFGPFHYASRGAKKRLNACVKLCFTCIFNAVLFQILFFALIEAYLKKCITLSFRYLRYIIVNISICSDLVKSLSIMLLFVIQAHYYT